MLGGISKGIFIVAVVIPIRPNTDDIQNYVEMRLDMDSEPEGMNDDLRVDIVRVIQENISDMCVRPFSKTPISDVLMYTY